MTNLDALLRKRIYDGEVSDEIPEEFQNVRDYSLSEIGKQRAWSVDVLTRANGYNIPSNWTTDHLDVLLYMVKRSIVEDNAIGTESSMLVAASCYLRAAGTDNEKIALEHNFGNRDLNFRLDPYVDREKFKRLASSKAKDKGKGVRFQNKRDKLLEEMAALKSEYMKSTDKMRKSELLKLIAAKKGEIVGVVDESDQEDDNSQERPTMIDDTNFKLDSVNRRYGLFVCAYLCRIMTKDPNNIDKSWPAKYQRFTNFYTRDEPPEEWTKPNRTWLLNVKQQFGLIRASKVTLLKMINYWEVNLPPEEPDLGMINYLFSTPLSYTGMHAYKLFCNVRTYSKKSTSWLLGQLRAPELIDGVREILNIHTYYEEGTENFNPSFRYARLFGPNYFPAIQTKACPDLVYLLSKMVMFYEKQRGEEQYRPDNIAGTDVLTDIKKAMWEKVAKDIAALASVKTDKEYSAVIGGRVQQFHKRVEKESDDETSESDNEEPPEMDWNML